MKETIKRMIKWFDNICDNNIMLLWAVVSIPSGLFTGTALSMWYYLIGYPPLYGFIGGFLGIFFAYLTIGVVAKSHTSK